MSKLEWIVRLDWHVYGKESCAQMGLGQLLINPKQCNLIKYKNIRLSYEKDNYCLPYVVFSLLWSRKIWFMLDELSFASVSSKQGITNHACQIGTLIITMKHN